MNLKFGIVIIQLNSIAKKSFAAIATCLEKLSILASIM